MVMAFGLTLFSLVVSGTLAATPVDCEQRITAFGAWYAEVAAYPAPPHFGHLDVHALVKHKGGVVDARGLLVTIDSKLVQVLSEHQSPRTMSTQELDRDFAQLPVSADEPRTTLLVAVAADGALGTVDAVLRLAAQVGFETADLLFDNPRPAIEEVARRARKDFVGTDGHGEIAERLSTRMRSCPPLLEVFSGRRFTELSRDTGEAILAALRRCHCAVDNLTVQEVLLPTVRSPLSSVHLLLRATGCPNGTSVLRGEKAEKWETAARQLWAPRAEQGARPCAPAEWTAPPPPPPPPPKRANDRGRVGGPAASPH